jgi:hypothetical protein
MEKLKVGDKVYNISKNRWSDITYYNLSEVVRLTKTQAVLENGTKLINELVTDYNREKCFSEYGDRYNKWYIQTPEILEKAKAEKEKQIVRNWFENRKFTDEEKKKIYLQFKKENILHNVYKK